MPHFLAIAWIYRDQYARAGLRMQPVYDPTGRGAGWRMVGYCLVLLPVSLAPLLFGAGGVVYGVGAALAGRRFPGLGGRFPADAFHATAWRVLRVSLLYLPAVFALLLLDAALR